MWARTRKLILSKNRVFDSQNLTHLLFSFLYPNDSPFPGAVENAYALDETHGRFATRKAVYSLDDFHSLAVNAQPGANQYLFDGSGSLRALVTATGRLECQQLP